MKVDFGGGMTARAYTGQVYMTRRCVVDAARDAARNDFDHREWSVADAEALEGLAAMIRRGYEDAPAPVVAKPPPPAPAVVRSRPMYRNRVDPKDKARLKSAKAEASGYIPTIADCDAIEKALRYAPIDVDGTWEGLGMMERGAVLRLAHYAALRLLIVG